MSTLFFIKVTLDTTEQLPKNRFGRISKKPKNHRFFDEYKILSEIYNRISILTKIF